MRVRHVSSPVELFLAMCVVGACADDRHEEEAEVPLPADDAGQETAVDSTSVNIMTTVSGTIIERVLAVGCTQVNDQFHGCTQGDGKRVEEVRSVGSFTRVTQAGPLQVQLSQAETFGVRVALDSNLVPFVSVETQGDTLAIDWKGETDFVTRLPGPHVFVTLPHLRSLLETGSGSIALSTQEAEPLELLNEGTGGVTFRGSAPHLTARVEGAGDIALDGSAQVADLTVEGQGAIDAHAFSAGSGSITSAGPGAITAAYTTDAKVVSTSHGSVDLTLAAPVQTVSAACSGTGGVTLRGATQTAELLVSGHGGIDARSLSAVHGSAKTTSTGSIEATFTGSVTATVEDFGSIDVYGGGELVNASSPQHRDQVTKH